jgi:hypothetical protein
MQTRPAFVVALVTVLGLACTKSESGAPTGTTETASTATASATPLASTPAVASASAAPSAAPADSVAAKAAPDGVKKIDAGTSATVAADAGSECGTKPLPDCPLQGWMKTNANPPVMANDLPALATALDKVVGFAPAGYANWASIARDGAAAARSGDLTAAKAACRTCHDQYKQKYKTELRARKL